MISLLVCVSLVTITSSASKAIISNSRASYFSIFIILHNCFEHLLLNSNRRNNVIHGVEKNWTWLSDWTELMGQSRNLVYPWLNKLGILAAATAQRGYFFPNLSLQKGDCSLVHMKSPLRRSWYWIPFSFSGLISSFIFCFGLLSLPLSEYILLHQESFFETW